MSSSTHLPQEQGLCWEGGMGASAVGGGTQPALGENQMLEEHRISPWLLWLVWEEALPGQQHNTGVK